MMQTKAWLQAALMASVAWSLPTGARADTMPPLRLERSIATPGLRGAMITATSAPAHWMWGIRSGLKEYSFAPDPALQHKRQTLNLLRAGLDEVTMRNGTDGLALRGSNDFSTLVPRAHANSAQLRQSLAVAYTADLAIWRSIARYVPVVTGNLDTTLGGSGQTSETSRFQTASIEASVPLYTSGQRYHQRRAAQGEALAAAFDALSQRDQVTMDLISAHLATSDARDTLALAEGVKVRSQRLVEAVRARMARGFASAAEATVARAALADAEAGVIEARATVASSEARIERLTGVPARGDWAMADLSGHVPPSIDAILTAARRFNPQLQAANARWHAQTAAADASRAAYLPQVSLTGDYTTYLDDVPDGRSRGGWNVGIRVSVPLVNAAAIADTQVERSRIESALAAEAGALQGIEQRVDELWHEFSALGQRIDAARTARDAQANAAHAAQKRFEAGFGELNDLLDRRNAADSARRNLQLLEGRRQLLAAQLLVTAGLFRPSMLDG